MNPFLDFLIPSVASCSAIPRRSKLHIPEGLFDVPLNEITSNIFRTTFHRLDCRRACYSRHDALAYDNIHAIGAILVSGIYEASLGQKILGFVQTKIENGRLSIAERKIAFPASYPRVICINSADGSGARSRYNPPPESTSHNFSVLGKAGSSAWPIGFGEGAEKRQWGTSTSTPIAAAIAALVLELAKQLKLDISHDVRLKTLEDLGEMFS